MLNKLWPRTRKSHPLSKFLRPTFEGQKPKKIFGLSLVAFVLLAQFLAPVVSALGTGQNGELVALETEVEVTTEKRKEFAFLDSEKCYLSQDYKRFHSAIDIACPKGTAIGAVRSGTIIFTGNKLGYGLMVVIDHGNQVFSHYAHLANIEVQEGQSVTQGTLIGRVGSTGWATGNHLHLEIRENEQYLNPKVFLADLIQS